MTKETKENDFKLYFRYKSNVVKAGASFIGYGGMRWLNKNAVTSRK